MKDYNEYRNDEIRRTVYNALAQISFEHDVSEEEMNKALKWFNDKFYEEQ